MTVAQRPPSSLRVVRPVPFFAATDVGNGERFVAQHGADLRWVQTRKCWMCWNGRTWSEDITREVDRRAKATARTIADEAQRAESAKHKELLGKWAQASESGARIEAMLNRARSEMPIPATTDVWDASPWLLNCANGTLDLQTGVLRAHCREDYLTKQTTVTYDPTARCPQWEKFLLRIFDGDLQLCDYMQRAIGYSLTGITSVQALHIMYGTGANGKTTFLKVMTSLFGDYGAQASFNTFLTDSRGAGRSSSAPSDDLARLAGKRMVRSSEAGEDKRFDEAAIKELTGNDTITARFLFERTFEFQPQFKLWLAANHKPVIRGTDHAIWRRVRLIPFTVTITDEERDDTLDEKLAAELSGILTWAVEGCQEWRRRGLEPPEVVRAATDQYREESDVVGAFLDDCCEAHPNNRIHASELFTAYLTWAKKHHEYEMSHTMFGRKLTGKDFKVEKIGGAKYRCGLALRADVNKG